MKHFRIGCITVVLVPVLTIAGGSGPSQAKETDQQSSQGHRSGMVARVIAADNTSRTIRLDGVGCSESMCSRVFIRTTSHNGKPLLAWFDSIASIDHITANDALFVMKDGTEQRLTFVSSFRILYTTTANGSRDKLDLAKIRSLEFLDAGK